MTVLALPLLFEAVRDRMAADATAQGAIPATHFFGWRPPAESSQREQGTWRRVVWTPGDEGDVGRYRAARQPGRNPRPLATLDELFTVQLEAADISGATPTERALYQRDELRQYSAARLLLDAWWRAAYLHAGPSLVVQSIEWLDDKKVAVFGAALKVVCSIEAMVPDLPLAEIGGAATPASAAGGTELLDVTDTDAVGASIPTVRATSTAPLALAGEQTVDGIALEDGDRVLLIAQTDATENGIWVVAAGGWTRADDELEHGTHVHSLPGGVVSGDAGFSLTTDDPITVGVTPLTFVRVSPPSPEEP